MPSQLSNWAADQLINWERGTTPDPVSSLELALYTSGPNADGTGTLYVSAALLLADPAGGSTSSNSGAVLFDAVPGGTITGAATRDGISGQIIRFRNDLNIVTTAGQNLAVNVGDLDLAYLPAT